MIKDQGFSRVFKRKALSLFVFNSGPRTPSPSRQLTLQPKEKAITRKQGEEIKKEIEKKKNNNKRKTGQQV